MWTWCNSSLALLCEVVGQLSKFPKLQIFIVEGNDVVMGRALIQEIKMKIVMLVFVCCSISKFAHHKHFRPTSTHISNHTSHLSSTCQFHISVLFLHRLQFYYFISIELAGIVLWSCALAELSLDPWIKVANWAMLLKGTEVLRKIVMNLCLRWSCPLSHPPCLPLHLLSLLPYFPFLIPV